MRSESEVIIYGLRQNDERMHEATRLGASGVRSGTGNDSFGPSSGSGGDGVDIGDRLGCWRNGFGHASSKQNAVNYSYLRASIGLRLAALRAGYQPKRMPRPPETPKARMIDVGERTKGRLINREMI